MRCMPALAASLLASCEYMVSKQADKQAKQQSRSQEVTREQDLRNELSFPAATRAPALKLLETPTERAAVMAGALKARRVIMEGMVGSR